MRLKYNSRGILVVEEKFAPRVFSMSTGLPDAQLTLIPGARSIPLA